MQTRGPLLWMTILILLMTSGCDDKRDQRLAELSERANQRQQEQNRTIAEQSAKTTDLSRQYLEGEAKSRQEMTELQKQLIEAEANARQDLERIHLEVVQRDTAGRKELDELHKQTQSAFAERTQAIDQQRDLLEEERQQIAAARQRDPVIAEAVKFAAGLIVCVLPLGVVVYLLRTLGRNEAGFDSEMVDLLVQEITAENPRLLFTQPPALPGPQEET
jgi:flagellar biosynthesis GTPase FlhF